MRPNLTRYPMLGRTLILGLFAYASHGTAQDGGQRSPPPAEKGVVYGRVTDPDGNPLAGVAITIENRALKRSGNLMTQGSGRYRFEGLDGGSAYELGFARRNYFVEVRSGIEVRPGEELEINIVMTRSLVQSLPSVGVMADPPKKGSPLARKYLGAEELANVKVTNLKLAIEKLRPRMLMKQYSIGFCQDSFSLYVDGLRRPVFDQEADSWDSTQMLTRRIPHSQVIFERELEWLRPGDIAEVRYVPCDDWDPQIKKRNVIWVITKRAAAAAKERDRETAERAAQEREGRGSS